MRKTIEINGSKTPKKAPKQEKSQSISKAKKSLHMTDKRVHIYRKPLTYLVLLVLSIVGTLTYYYISNPDISTYVFNRYILNNEPNYISPYKTYTVSISSSVTDEDKQTIQEQLSLVVYRGTPRYEIVDTDGEINITYSMESVEGKTIPASYLLPVGHFYWIKEGVTTEELNEATILLDKSDTQTEAILTTSGYSTETTEDILTDLKGSEEHVTLIPLERLSFDYKLLTLDGNYYLDTVKEDPTSLEGTLPYYISFTGEKVPDHIYGSLHTHLNHAFNSDEEAYTNIFTINQTGVTAITRKLTSKVISSGDGAYPATSIGDFLSSADLTHVSNEISFAPNCTNAGGMSFCSREETIDSLIASGVDIVELTGNHNNDYGSDNNTDTINAYTNLGMEYFGGGLETEDAAKPLYKDVGDKTVAFLGFNYWNAVNNFTGALATDSRAGANPYSKEAVVTGIAEAKESSDFIIVDFQFTECYSYPEGRVLYPICYKPIPNQREVFKAAIDAGADMVVGTQAHQPQTYEIYNGKPIFYGLGNLFFDQVYWPGTRHGIVLTHYFLNGEYVQTKLTTTNYNNDMITYVSIGEERQQLLELLKEARN